MNAQTRSEIAELLSSHGLAPNRRLGQHFLADPNITRKIVAVAGVGEGTQVVEIGAGTGTLSRALAEAGASVVAYEVDRGLASLLEEVTDGVDVEVRFEDVTDVHLGEELGGGRWVMVSNLPYNVGTPVVLDAIQRAPAIERFVVMVQREVADRLTALPGSKSYGLPSVIAGIYTEASLSFTVPPQVFYPPPNVDSAVVILERVPVPVGAERAVELARAGFGQRRKMLRRSLEEMIDNPEAALVDVGLRPTARAEELTPSDYLQLART